MATDSSLASLWNSSTENLMNTIGITLGEATQSTNSLIYGSILLITAAITVVANGIVIVLTLKDPLKNLRTSPAGYFVLCLACTDFTVGAVQELLQAIWLMCFAIHDTPPFQVSAVFTVRTLMLTASISILLALGLERMIAVRFPLRYKNIVTIKKVRAAIICISLYSLLLAVLYGSLFETSFFLTNTIFLGIILSSFVVIVVIYITLLVSLSKQSISLKKVTDSQNVLSHAVQRQKKVTNTTIVIITTFGVCFLPWVLCFFLFSLCGSCSLRALAIAIPYVSSLMYLNSLVNPFIYAYCLPKYKQAFKHFRTKPRDTLWRLSESRI